jgi:propanol-preferring alcohol dehydrogenase
VPKAARFHKVSQPLVIEQMETPRTSEDEALLRIQGAGICHTDLHLVDTGMLLNPPVTLGHEIAGVIEEVGSSVLHFKRGDRAVVHFWNPCGACYYCERGEEMLCLNLFTRPSYGITHDGGYADYCSVDAKRLVLVPSEIPMDFAATLGCAGLTAYHALSNFPKSSLGENVVVYGVGGLGMYAIQIARNKGANVIAIGRREEKMKIASDLGANYVIDGTKENISLRIKDATKNRGADTILSFVPWTGNEVLRNCVDSLANGGRLVFVGLGTPVSIDPTPFIFRGFSLSGSFFGSKKELAEVLNLAKRNEIKSIVARKIELEAVNEGMQALRNGEIMGRCVVRS